MFVPAIIVIPISLRMLTGSEKDEQLFTITAQSVVKLAFIQLAKSKYGFCCVDCCKNIPSGVEGSSKTG
jgi:hypothetical protein